MKIVFLHGLGQDESSWSKVQHHMSSYCTEALPLFDKSDDHYPDIRKKVLNLLQDQRQPFVLVGLSLGGVLALDLSQNDLPLLKGLVLSGTQYKLKGNWLYLLQLWLFRTIPKWVFKKQGADKQQMLTLLEDLVDLDLSQAARSTQVPSLVICGSKDRANLNASRSLKNLLPQASLKLIENGGHTLNTQSSEQLAQEIKTFIKTL